MQGTCRAALGCHDCLARLLLSKPWSDNRPREKRVEGEEVAALLVRFGIRAVYGDEVRAVRQRGATME